MKTYFLLPNKMNPAKIRHLVEKANEYEDCQIFVEYNTLKINAKSLLSMSLLNGMEGMCCVYAQGEKSRNALETLRELCTSKG